MADELEEYRAEAGKQEEDGAGALEEVEEADASEEEEEASVRWGRRR